MSGALSIAVSGLAAQSQRLAAISNNIANVNTTGVLPTQSAPVSTVYRPLSVSFTALTAGDGIPGGVRAEVTADPDGYSPVYDPSSIYANSEGLIAAPNVDIARELVNLIETKSVYKANVSVIKTQSEMLNELLNTIV